MSESKLNPPRSSAPATKAAPSTDKETEQGFRGVQVDKTPNEAYTVAGVTSGMPTPETDLGAAKAAREASGLGLSGLEAAARENAATLKK